MDSMAKQKMMAAKLEGTTWISALQLALWDNIFGPRVDQVPPHRGLGIARSILWRRFAICGVAVRLAMCGRRRSRARAR
jgi:hypothetical protein